MAVITDEPEPSSGDELAMTILHPKPKNKSPEVVQTSKAISEGEKERNQQPTSSDDSLKITQVIHNVYQDIDKADIPIVIKPEDPDSEWELQKSSQRITPQSHEAEPGLTRVVLTGRDIPETSHRLPNEFIGSGE